MPYKILFCVLFLSWTQTAGAQRLSPIIIKTGKPTPSVVRTGELFRVTYRAEFLDTVIILQEQMNPGNLMLVPEKEDGSSPAHADVVNLSIEPKERVYSDSLGFVNVWDFNYTLRIIHPKKGKYKLPSFNFLWINKKAGVTELEAREKEKPKEFPTQEVGINYISSIIEPPNLDIRDTILFSLPLPEGFMLRRQGYGVIVVGSFFLVLVSIKFLRGKQVSVKDATQAIAGRVEENQSSSATFVYSPKQARKQFLKELRNRFTADRELECRDMRDLLRSLLLAELPRFIKDSMSGYQMYETLSSLTDQERVIVGRKLKTMTELARRLRNYQEQFDLGDSHISEKEIIELYLLVHGLKTHVVFFNFFKGLLPGRG